MVVQDVIDYAVAGELSQLFIADTAEASNINKILTYINLGLIELYKRFTLRTEEELVTMITNTTLYTLDVEVNRILEVYDENGSLLPLNSETEPLSILTPTWNTIQVPYPSDGDVLSIIYTAPPVKLTDVTDTVPIPSTLLEALLHYIGYRAHGSIDGNINTENNTHYMRFEASCKRVEELGLITQNDLTGLSIDSRGFV